MATALLDDPVLTTLRRRLEEMYGPRLARVVLFGSRARGDHHADSDYDVAVFLRTLPDRWAERKRLAHLRVTLLEKTGEFLDMKSYLATEWPDRTPLMGEIRREGRDF